MDMFKKSKNCKDFKAGKKVPNYLNKNIYGYPECIGKVLPDPIYYYTSDDGSTLEVY